MSTLRVRHSTKEDGPMVCRVFPTITLFVFSWLVPLAATGEPFVANFTLDPFSLISFGDKEVYSLPEGATIKFRFASAEGQDQIAFEIRPFEAVLGPVRLRSSDESMEFALSSPAQGRMRKGSDGQLVMEAGAAVVVTLNHPEKPGFKRMSVRFTTENATALSLDGFRKIDVAGARVSGRGVQLVGTATNAADDYPQPGEPVYVILSGVFDRLPTLR
jgi:hypothetical protein